MQKQEKLLLLSEEVERAINQALYAQAIDIYTAHGRDVLVKNICRNVSNYLKKTEKNKLAWELQNSFLKT